MARMPRVVVPGYPHHVTQRGNRRQKIFFCDGDYRYYIQLLSESAAVCAAEIWAYCLMPNHIHLVMVPDEEDGLRAVLGEAHRRYTRYINFRECWRGHLWQERFHSFVMNEQYLLATVRYVERNPVAARLCGHPADWPWSSAAAHLAGVDDSLVTVKPLLERVKDWGSYLSINQENHEAHQQIQQHSRTGRPLGDPEFAANLEVLTGKQLAPRKPGRKPVGGSG